MLKRYRLRDYDFKLVILVTIISVIGVIAVGSAQQSIQDKQVLGMVLGTIAMVILSLFDYTILLRLVWPMYILNLVLLVMVRFLGKEVNGATRWVEIMGIQFQPSELSKIILILFYAQFIMKYKDKLNTLKILLSAVVLLLPPLLLIYKQPNLSTSIMVCVIFCVMLFVGGLSFKIIGSILAVAVPAGAVVFYMVLQEGQKLIESYQQERILAWLDKEKYANGAAYQQLNSMMAIGSGQLGGKGLNQNMIASVKNGNFISEPQTDFIFAVIGEELGFVGACVVIVLIILIALECLSIARKAQDTAGMVIASGVAGLIGFQGFINISVTTGILPNTGIPLPFVSAGLTSLVSLYIGIGLVLNVRLQAKKY